MERSECLTTDEATLARSSQQRKLLPDAQQERDADAAKKQEAGEHARSLPHANGTR